MFLLFFSTNFIPPYSDTKNTAVFDFYILDNPGFRVGFRFIIFVKLI